MNEDIIGSANIEETWNMFLEYIDEYPEVYERVFVKGIKITFNFGSYLRKWGVRDHELKGKISFIQGGKRIMYNKEDVDNEIHLRVNLMKKALREINIKRPLASVRLNKGEEKK